MHGPKPFEDAAEGNGPVEGMAQLYEVSLQGRKSVALSTRMQSIEC